MSSRPVKVCIMLPAHWSSTPGGAELQVRYLVQTLVQRPDVLVYYLCRDAAVETSDGAAVVRLAPRGPLSRYVYLVDYPQAMAALRRIAPDVIYARVGSAYVGIAARYCRTTGCRLVWHIALETDVLPYAVRSRRALVRLADRLLFEHGARQADAIIGQAVYQDALLEARFQRRCAAIIPNFHPLPESVDKPRDGLRVVWVASIKPAKRPEAFVELARLLRDRPDIRFVMIGPVQDDPHGRLRNQLAELPNLTYLGPLPLEQVNEEIARSHLFVNTSRIEGFPNTFVQAWLRRTVVLSLSVDPDRVLSHEGCGRLSGTVERLAAEVRALADDADLRERLAERAYRHAAAHHSMANAERLVDVILAQARTREEQSCA